MCKLCQNLKGIRENEKSERIQLAYCFFVNYIFSVLWFVTWLFDKGNNKMIIGLRK